MIRFLGTMMLLFAFFATVGYFRGWFVVQTNSSSNESHINVTVNKTAIREDKARMQSKAADVSERGNESAVRAKAVPNNP